MIEKLIQSIQNLQDVEVSTGFDPEHPTRPDKQKSEIINAYFNKFPLLNKYLDYMMFMKKYAGM